MQYPGDYPRYVHLPLRPPDPLTRATRFLAYLPVRAVNKIFKAATGRAAVPLPYEDTRHRRYGVPHRELGPKATGNPHEGHPMHDRRRASPY